MATKTASAKLASNKAASTKTTQSVTASKMPAQKMSHVDAIKAQFEALSQQEQGELLRELTMTYNAATNAVAQLAAKVQKIFGANLTTEIWTEGEAHQPVVYCKLIMPDGSEFVASGKNQKLAKQFAAEQALAALRGE
jgi:dsRNA-specific ribonuclease